MKTKICTTIEQSQKLIRLGLDMSTADLGWNISPNGSVRLLSVDDWVLVTDDKNVDKIVPAWSLSALIELLPYQSCLVRDFRTKKFRCRCIGLMDTYWCDTSLDAAFEMVCWIKNNTYLL